MKAVIACLAACGTLLSECPGQEQPKPSSTHEVSPGAKAPLIIPQPKFVKPGVGRFHVRPDAKWLVRATTPDKRLWQAAQSVFDSKWCVSVDTTQSWIALELGSSSQMKFPTGLGQPPWAADPEGYRLAVDTNGLTILASTAQGAFYGLQTLAQLWQQSSNRSSCPTIEIEDWPAMRFRGVHWFPSASGVPMHLKLITNVFGAFKFNRSVIQCEAARWDKHPEITDRNAVSKAGLHAPPIDNVRRRGGVLPQQAEIVERVRAGTAVRNHEGVAV